MTVLMTAAAGVDISVPPLQAPTGRPGLLNSVSREQGKEALLAIVGDTKDR